MAINDPTGRTERLVSAAEAAFAAEFVALVSTIRSQSTLEELALLIERGDIEGAFRVLDRAAPRLGVVFSQQFVRAGEDTSRFLNRELGEIVIDFDMTNARAVRMMQENSLRLVREFTEAQRRATREALVDGITRGLNPREQARAFRDSIGLTAHQQRAVQNYRRALEELDSDALRRELRDRRFDPTVRRAIENDTPLSRKRIDNMVTRYRQRFIKYRSEVIARTEALRSVHQGVREMYTQAVANGDLMAQQLVQTWQTALDERVRDFPKAQTSHRTMHGQERLLASGEPFVSGAGNQALHPGGFGVAMEDIQCRCTLATRILSLDELPEFANITVLQ